MDIIQGRDVDLLTPFPSKEFKRIWGWVRCYRTLVETTNFPQTEEEFVERFSQLKNIQTFGIIDKNNILSIRHEVPLIGFLTFEKETILNGNFHLASTRKAWGSRLTDQALHLLIKHVFDTNPDLARVSGVTLAANAPAKALMKRLGFVYEGCLRDSITINDVPSNMVIFGLTRRDWEEQHLVDMVIEPVMIVRPPKPDPVGVMA